MVMTCLSRDPGDMPKGGALFRAGDSVASLQPTKCVFVSEGEGLRRACLERPHMSGTPWVCVLHWWCVVAFGPLVVCLVPCFVHSHSVAAPEAPRQPLTQQEGTL